MEPWGRSGASSATLGRQVGSRTLHPERRVTQNRLFERKWGAQGSISGPTENPEWHQNRTFEKRSAPGPSKNALWAGSGKNMKNQWKMDRKE